MKAPNLKKWKISTKIEGLLFFAQLVNELLFDYSLDTYKLPALNSRLLIEEILFTIEDYEVGSLKKGNIEPTISELQDRLRKDPVIKEIMSKYYPDYLSMITNDIPVPELKLRVLFLYNKISKSYLLKSKEMLENTINKGKEKEVIVKLTKIFLAELIECGYSSQYLYFKSNRFFFSGSFPKQIDDSKIIAKYFEQFSLKEKHFFVMYRGRRNIQAIKEYSHKLSLEILDSPPKLDFRQKSKTVEDFFSNNKKYPLFILLNNIVACDRDKAREEADSYLFFIDSLAKYRIHQWDLCIGENALIYTSDQKDFGIVSKAKSPVLKRPDQPLESLPNLIKKTISTVTSENLKKESIQRLLRAFLRHNAAIKATAPESQLLEFWSAIEVLFPPKEVDTDRIIQITNSLIPYLFYEYAAKLATDLYFSLKRSRISETLNELQKVPEGESNVEKCLALISVNSNETIRAKLYSLLSHHPLLKNRIYYLSQKFSSADIVAKTLDAHNRRISWQIMRIYRARNLIIHSGKTLPYINILVENLHNYLDRALDVLNEEIYRSTHSITLDQISLEIKLKMESHIRRLRNFGKTECTPDNYKQILFGN